MVLLRNDTSGKDNFLFRRNIKKTAWFVCKRRKDEAKNALKILQSVEKGA